MGGTPRESPVAPDDAQPSADPVDLHRQLRGAGRAFAAACHWEGRRQGIIVGSGVTTESYGGAVEVAFGAWWPEMFVPNVRFRVRVERQGGELTAAYELEHEAQPVVVHRGPLAEPEEMQRAIGDAAPHLVARIVEKLRRKLDPRR